jgi:hypothetical protein
LLFCVSLHLRHLHHDETDELSVILLMEWLCEAVGRYVKARYEVECDIAKSLLLFGVLEVGVNVFRALVMAVCRLK